LAVHAAQVLADVSKKYPLSVLHDKHTVAEEQVLQLLVQRVQASEARKYPSAQALHLAAVVVVPAVPEVQPEETPVH